MIPKRPLASAAVSLFVAALWHEPARALDLTDMATFYHEDFAGETGTPTTPEIDSVPIGTVNVFSTGNGPPAAPTINGQVDYSLGNVDGAAAIDASGLSLAPTPLTGVDAIAVRALFDDFTSAITDDGLNYASVMITVDDPGTTNVLLYAFLQHIGIFGSSQYNFVLGAFDLIGAASLGTQFVALDPAAITALTSGQPVEIDLLFRRETGEVEASATIGGSSFQPTVLSIPVGDSPVVGFAANANVRNEDQFGASYGEDDTSHSSSTTSSSSPGRRGSFSATSSPSTSRPSGVKRGFRRIRSWTSHCSAAWASSPRATPRPPIRRSRIRSTSSSLPRMAARRSSTRSST